ncbi:MAG TPA: MerR family transcriptional regulator [Kofleriaceae bacterium]|nr:MerR family transcriptional regulator [Kofleriaceae bacterium]
MFSRHRGWTAHGPSTGTVVPFRAHRRRAVTDVAPRSDDDAPSTGAGPTRGSLLKEEDLRAIEGTYPEGITAVQIVDAFTSRGIKFSEASFRKYVQQGLLPRSRRVGRKGKHRGSQGLYPVEAVRRINAIKKMMAEGLTLEEIRRSFVFFKNSIDEIDRGLDGVLDGFQHELRFRAFGDRRKRELETELTELRRRSEDLLKDMARLGSAVTVAPAGDANSAVPPREGT